MNLYALLRNRVADGEPIRIGVIGAGKFGTMFLAQARTTPGMHVVAVADLAESRARRALSGRVSRKSVPPPVRSPTRSLRVPPTSRRTRRS
jgi:predicted homoserine dehydrogenase-like protein